MDSGAEPEKVTGIGQRWGKGFGWQEEKSQSQSARTRKSVTEYVWRTKQYISKEAVLQGRYREAMAEDLQENHSCDRRKKAAISSLL